MAIARLDLFIVLRNQVRDRDVQRRALAVEAVMEELARELGADPELWGLAGLGAEIDARLATGNPEARGALAEELLRTEGVPPEAAAAARLARAATPEDMPPVARALSAAWMLVDLMVAELAEPEMTFDRMEPVILDHRMRRRVRRGDEAAARVQACLDLLALPRMRAAELAVAACRRAREDLGW